MKDALLENWANAFGITVGLLFDNGLELTVCHFQHRLDSLSIKHVSTPMYHPQINGYIERYNSSTITGLHHYVTRHQRHWDDFVRLLTYA